ncbi:MAG: hypothetical protein IKX40_01885 [Thermoguttaceae bacterium]|nr:hypothetical protein [Thermoguttaceae bacterium]
MQSEKNRTQVRAEISWFWQREADGYDQKDYGSVMLKQYKTDTDDNRLEGVWSEKGLTLAENSSSSIELDYLTRKTVGGTLDIGFLDVRCLLAINHGPGKLIVKPGATSSWEGPWNSSVSQKNVIPPGGAVLLSAGDAPWKVTIIANTLTFEADDDKCLYDVAIVGKIGDVPSSSESSSGSSETSNSSSSEASSSSSSSESINN